MKNLIRPIGFALSLILYSATTTSFAQQTSNNTTQLKIYGYLGERIDDCIQYRVKGQDVDHLVEPFRHQNETSRWQSEFWGKWIQGAIASYRYNKDPELYQIIREGVEKIMATQLPNGYIGNYTPEAQLQQWDVWGRKYTTLGLIAWFDLSGDKKALDAACKVVDHLMTQVGPDKTNIVETGNYRGMASSSILEPVIGLYNRTKEKRYLDFATYIVEQWETPEGPQLISKSIADVPVAHRYPHPVQWFSRENGQKAYEMMSCYEGLLELYKITKNPLYLSVVEKTTAHIINEEINITGSGSAFECWYGGKEKQTFPTYHTMETCVTFTWMQLCHRLLQLTGNSLYADQIELSIYNALLASLKGNGSQIAKYSPLEGWRHEGEEQCGMHINCCNANGPRAFALIPNFAYQTKDDCLFVNLYSQSDATIQLSGKKQVRIKQTTDYPLSETVSIQINPDKEDLFSIAFRIPSWSKQFAITINGEPVQQYMQGSYLTVNRKWKKGDEVILNFDMRAKLVELNQSQAIVRGPVVFARDSRFNDGDIDEASVILDKDGYVDIKPIHASDFAWMTFTAPMILGTDLEGHSASREIHFCDFASAGNSWDISQRYRVWLPKTLNVMNTPYKPY
ncbi:beta-L-arabinofuranosidase domain-containing protein [Parabacteroides sp. PF5-9]|uniref:glycoside hydrolase family 127 protein n=1 Tax=Parabacteroides sp. PF5-9 TaxID=1742404 RepID=UPI002476F8CB|nr:beta-L-arabinofuranosidase domain-containing protein [Parabacteroides sp. PF5-9]MDH6358604.1 DUF1680 family protein [Parabacteroides sp. PF5-9]